MKMTASSTAAPLLLLVLCMIAASAQARPMSLSGESAIVEPEIMQPGAQHYRFVRFAKKKGKSSAWREPRNLRDCFVSRPGSTKVRRRYVETEVATKLAKQLAFTQRLNLLSDLFKSVNSGKYKANNFQVRLENLSYLTANIGAGARAR